MQLCYELVKVLRILPCQVLNGGNPSSLQKERILNPHPFQFGQLGTVDKSLKLSLIQAELGLKVLSGSLLMACLQKVRH
jgi:hypothetical protein